MNYRTGSAIKRKPSAIALSSSSSSSSNGPSDDDDSSDEGGGGGGISAKPVNLPQWAKVSGADLKKQAMGSKPNRKKRRMSVDSDEESESGSGSEDGDGEETGDDTDDSVLGKKKKKKGKGKAKGKGKESPKKNDRRRVMRIPSADEDADEADSEDDIKELIIDPPSSATRSSRSRRLDSIPAAARGEDESTPRYVFLSFAFLMHTNAYTMQSNSISTHHHLLPFLPILRRRRRRTRVPRFRRER